MRRIVEEAHETAVAAGLEYLDQAAGHTRAGDGGVRKVPGEGFIIAQFRHRTSRSTDPATRVGDPQLHSHCAILNRIRGVDGTWRTLDSRAIYRNAHAAGAVYGAVFERELSERLGVSWVTPERRVPMRDIAGIPRSLIARFSTRRAAVLETYEQLEAEWRAIHGRTPTDERSRQDARRGDDSEPSPQGRRRRRAARPVARRRPRRRAGRGRRRHRSRRRDQRRRPPPGRVGGVDGAGVRRAARAAGVVDESPRHRARWPA